MEDKPKKHRSLVRPFLTAAYFSLYLLANSSIGYIPTRALLEEGMDKSTIEQKFSECFKEHPFGETVGKIYMGATKPGRELAYFFHTEKE